MSLIVIPVGAGEGVTSLRHLARLVSEGEGGRARSPLTVVPDTCEQWESVAAEIAPSGIALSIDAARDVGARVEAALAAVQKHRLSAEYGTTESSSDMLLIVPVVHAESAEAITPLLTRLTEITTAIDTALVRAFRGTASIGFPDMAFVPWAFLPDSTAILSAAALFAAPSSILGGAAKPIVRFGERRGMRSDWSGHGETQLAIDLLALYALSAEGAEVLKEMKESGGGRSQFLVAHGAVAELPWNRIGRTAVLRALIGGDTPLLAAPAEKKDEESATASQAASTSVRVLGQYIEPRHVKADAFREVPVELAPRRGDFVTLDIARRADRLHTRFHETLRNDAAEKVNQIGGEAVVKAQAMMESYEDTLQKTLQAALTSGHADEPVGAATMRRARAERTQLQSLLERVTGKRHEDPERIVEEAAGVRGSWCAREEALLEEGSRIPMHGAVVGATVAVTLCTLLISGLAFRVLGAIKGWSDITVYALTISFTIGLGAAFYFLTEWGVRAYFDRWTELEESIRNSMRSSRERLADVCNQRVSNMLASSLPGLMRRQQAAVNRLRTELAGLASLCREELAKVEESQSDEERHTPELGRFRYHGEMEIGDRSPFLSRLNQILTPVVTLTQSPQWVRLDQYREFLEGLVRQTVVDRERLRPEVEQKLHAADAYARSDRFMPAFNDADVCEIDTRTISICGNSAAADAPNARAASAMPEEIALFLTLRRYEIIRDTLAS